MPIAEQHFTSFHHTGGTDGYRSAASTHSSTVTAAYPCPVSARDAIEGETAPRHRS